MTAKTLLTSLFRYKAAADDELLQALEDAAPTASSADFRTALRVLAHAHTVDRIFLANLQGAEHGFAANWSAEPPAFDALAADVRETDRSYLDCLGGMGPEALDQPVGFVFTDGQRGCMSREEMLAHVITHSGYHRGEVGRLLSEVEAAAVRDVFAGYLHRTEPHRREAA